MAIREADEPVHRCSCQGAHEQLASHRIGPTKQHHLCMKSCEVSLRVLCPSEGHLEPYECGWYHNIHDFLRERRWELPRRCHRFLICTLTLTCAGLQISAQFLVRTTQFFARCLQRYQVSLDAFLVCSRRGHLVLKGSHRPLSLL